MRIALTGGTGFVGGHVLDAALGAGHSVAALTRRDQPPRAGVEWIAGALEDGKALKALVKNADAVIHLAGVISAAASGGFERGNVIGTGAVLAAAEQAGTRRFVHVSSLAAREPKLSRYGKSKARSEDLVSASPLSHAIVRPPAVYGPGDRETLELFKMAARGLVLLPPKAARLSLIHVADLARLLLALAGPAAPAGAVFEPDDGRPGGWSQAKFGAALAAATGRKARILHAPAPLMKVAALADRAARGARAKLTPDRAAYFAHPDWVADPARAVPSALWRPEVDTAQGLADTAAWYRAAGWL